MFKPNWSKPHHGSEHLDVPEGYQISVEDGFPLTARLFHFNGSAPYTPVKTFRGTIEECKREGEKWAESLPAIT